MHTQGVEEVDADTWLVRSECRGCGLRVGAEGPAREAVALVDRLLWSDDARHVLDRLPPYLAPLVQDQAERYAQSAGHRVITFTVLAQARHGGAVVWDPEAERRLERVPGPVRSMARLELERTAAERGEARVTVALVEEVKARYFGMFAKSGEG
ncbi:PCP reductase family protein [Nitrospira sp. Kam-Ns4a]